MQFKQLQSDSKPIFMVFLIPMLNPFDFLIKNHSYVVYSNINANKANNTFLLLCPLRAKRGDLIALSLRAKRGNLLGKNGFLLMRLTRHFVPRNDAHNGHLKRAAE